MRPRVQPQPYQILPTLKPEGGVVETIYGRKQKRSVISQIPLQTVALASVSLLSFGSIAIGKLIKESQIIIPFDYTVILVATTPNDANLNILNASVDLGITGFGSVWGTAMETPFTGGPKLINTVIMKALLPPMWRWDDYARIDGKVKGFLDSILSVDLNVQNIDGALAHSFTGTAILTYDTEQLEFS